MDQLQQRIKHHRRHTIVLGVSIVVIVLSLIIMGRYQARSTHVDQYRSKTKIVFSSSGENEVSLNAEIADTPYKHEYGLMFRGQMNRGDGMLFVFDEEKIRGFWMKNTYIPLDLIFLNSNKTIVSIYTGAKIQDETALSSIYPAKYVIEVNSGWVEEAGLAVGQQVEFDSKG